MKNKKAVKTAVSIALAAVLSLGTVSALAGCRKGERTLVIMTQELNGLFNPFYSTAGTDMDVAGQTQISMFTTDSNGDIAYGDAEPVVVKDFKQESVTEGGKDYTDYTFVLKNGIVFSDGEPLTMNDVLFNLYVYLDPAYTGSSTMYSTDIVGLKEYRTQSTNASTDDDALTKSATGRAVRRRTVLLNAYDAANKKLHPTATNTYDVTIDQMRDFIQNEFSIPAKEYYDTIWPNGTPPEGGDAAALAREQLLADYNEVVRLFEEELNNDYNAAKDAYQAPPYVPKKGKAGKNDSNVKFDGKNKDVVSFMYMEGYITLAYDRVTQADGTVKEDMNHIVQDNGLVTTSKNYNVEAIELSDPEAARAAAIDFVLNAKLSAEFHDVLTYWATGGTVLSNYLGKAKDVVLHEKVGTDGGQMVRPNIEGVKSLGHSTEIKEVNIGEKTYKVAHDYNADGTVKNDGEYAVLRIRINKIDPKAIWNFGFTVAPYHYYSDPNKYPINIKENQFGLAWGSFDYHTNVLQGNTPSGVSKNKVPLGAGPYVASDRNGGDDPGANDFLSNNIVYYKANEKFFTDVEDAAETLHPPLIKRMNYQVVSSTNALYQLEHGGVHFVEPQATKENNLKLQSLSKKGFESVKTWQLGYGYIGINAGKVDNINLRKAIMSAMRTGLALSYYDGGDAATIYWPMSLVSWAYPRTAGNELDPSNPLLNDDQDNKHDYAMYTTDEAAIDNINRYMGLANATRGDSRLKLQFTIAGSDLTDHPCFNVMNHAKDLLNSCGWDVEVISDVQALTKLSTGSLTVWAAAWGSTIDPDMYQVYHKNSTASSVYAWGYREILGNQSKYSTEMGILNKLSAIIEDARETNERNGDNGRIELYKQAMGLVLDLAVELPVYQRKTLYAYNAKVIDKDTLPKEINSYTSPLSRIWEVDFVK